jgi:hypothetical protein
MADDWVCGKVCSEFWGMVVDAFGVFMCGDGVGCACDNDWLRDTCGDGVVGVTYTAIRPLPVEYRPREDKVLPPLLVPLPDI